VSRAHTQTVHFESIATPLRAEASRVNGKRSLGPVSPYGKLIASMNGVRHGLASRSILLPSEKAEDYETNVNAWANTLQPASPAESLLVARIADLDFRLGRLQRLEDRHRAADLEAKLKETDAFKLLGATRNASQGVAAMLATVTELRAGCSGEHLTKLLSPIRAVFEMVEAVSLPTAVLAPLGQLYEDLKFEATGQEVDVVVFERLIGVAGSVLQALDQKVVALETEIGAEREQIADSQLFGDDKEFRKFQRHRAAINKALDAELARLKVVRELAQGGSGSSVGPILVELKLIGRKE
jgi:hypothetical protein